MLTLTEVEAAADRLPASDREALLRHLQAAARAPRAAALPPAARDEWMRELDHLRSSLGSSAPTLSSERLIDDLRAE